MRRTTLSPLNFEVLTNALLLYFNKASNNASPSALSRARVASDLEAEPASLQ